MSLEIPIKNISSFQIPVIEKKLTVCKQEENNSKKKKYNYFRDEICFIRKKKQDMVLFPFSWAVQYFGSQYRPIRTKCHPMNSRFNGNLRTEQLEIQKECINYLNQSSSCILAVYPGGGKCLAKGQKVLLWNGNYKNVEKLQITDLLMGDDYSPRHIHSLTKGYESLFRIYHKNMYFCSAFHYIVNKSHILTLYDKTQKIIRDIPLLAILNGTENISNFYGVYMDVDALPYFSLVKKRIYIHNLLNKYGYIKSLNETEFLTDCMKCGLQITSFMEKCKIIDSYNVLSQENINKRVIQYYPIGLEFISINKYYGFELSGNGRFLLYQGICTHNTITSLSIASKIGLRTLIFVNKLVLMEQWIESIQKVFGPDVSYDKIETKHVISKQCDFYIMNAINAEKFDLTSLNIGFVIVDECHLIVTKTLSNALFSVQPRYLLGLSATPYRPDGFNILLELFFGPYHIVRPLYRKHIVYMVPTKIKINIQKDERGNLIWNSVIHQQCHNELKNRFIYDLCQEHKDRNILILTKRIEQMNLIHKIFETQGKQNDLCIMTGDTFDPSVRILIATIQKVGVGFSHDKLDMLILACDTEEYFIQYLGRVFRRPDVIPIIYDLIDEHPILKKHFQKRRQVYLSCGGSISIRNFNFI